LRRPWDGKNFWLNLTLVLDCGTRQLRGRHLPRAVRIGGGRKCSATHYVTLGRIPAPSLLRSDNDLECTNLG
jgi:putative transposase